MRFFQLVLSFLCLTGCTKTNTASAIDEPVTAGTQMTISSGNFLSNVHATSGQVIYAKDSLGKRRIQFSNFKTDSGPDLRVWLAKSESPSDYQELGILKATTGNFSYEINSTIDPQSYPYVLIWCEDFSVLFGHAQLK